MLQRQIDRSVERARASTRSARRCALELQAGYRNIGFETRRGHRGLLACAPASSSARRAGGPAGARRLHLFESTAALVHDTSVFGATSPILGQRFRLEVSPTLGSVNYTGVLADFRQYVMPVRPFTLAGRVLHYGRYGAGGEDPRLHAAVPRLPEPRARLRHRLVQRLRVRRRRRRAARSSTSSWAAACWSATSSCACRCSGSSARKSLYGPLPDRDRRLLRRRRGLDGASTPGAVRRRAGAGEERRRYGAAQPVRLRGPGGRLREAARPPGQERRTSRSTCCRGSRRRSVPGPASWPGAGPAPGAPAQDGEQEVHRVEGAGEVHALGHVDPERTTRPPRSRGASSPGSCA